MLAQLGQGCSRLDLEKVRDFSSCISQQFMDINLYTLSLDYSQEALFKEPSWPFPNFFWAKATVPCEHQTQGWGVHFPVQIDVPGPSSGNPRTEEGTIEPA